VPLSPPSSGRAMVLKFGGCVQFGHRSMGVVGGSTRLARISTIKSWAASVSGGSEAATRRNDDEACCRNPISGETSQQICRGSRFRWLLPMDLIGGFWAKSEFTNWSDMPPRSKPASADTACRGISYRWAIQYWIVNSIDQRRNRPPRGSLVRSRRPIDLIFTRVGLLHLFPAAGEVHGGAKPDKLSFHVIRAFNPRNPCQCFLRGSNGSRSISPTDTRSEQPQYCNILCYDRGQNGVVPQHPPDTKWRPRVQNHGSPRMMSSDPESPPSHNDATQPADPNTGFTLC
jgi:hypothetical protein